MREDTGQSRVVPTGATASPQGLAAGTSGTAPPSELLRRYEPVLRFTDGELFLPADVGSYVAQCSLWAAGSGRGGSQLLSAGGVTLDRLDDLGRRFRDHALHLRFVQQPLSRQQVRVWRRAHRPQLRGTARLAAVGLLARLVDALLRLSLLVRGRVPGGLAAAAERTTGAHLAARGHPYYGRVVQGAGYTVLQYWFFYPFNDWRSSFHGVNDHEADWELVTVYLVGDGEHLRPAWVAASSHDHDGDVLRRRWDDPGLHREGAHPVVYPGAGSHSGAFVPGDYVVSVEVPALRRAVDGVLRRWRRSPSTRGFALPFVDYARGDGVAVGPGQPDAWRAEVIDDGTPWVWGYRGLWGLDTHDAFGGERAPAGPRYERSGVVRGAWVDPLGWAGLASVSPTEEDERAALRARLDELSDRLSALDAAIAGERNALRGLRATARSLGAHADTRSLRTGCLATVAARESGLRDLVGERTRLTEECAAHTEFLSRLPTEVPPDDHLRDIDLPTAVDAGRHTAFLRAWAAVTTPVLVLGTAALLASPTPATLVTGAAVLAAVAAVEALAHRRFRLLLTVLVTAALWTVAAGSLVVAALRNWQLVVAALLTLAALVLLVLNLRELVGRPAPGHHEPSPRAHGIAASADEVASRR